MRLKAGIVSALLLGLTATSAVGRAQNEADRVVMVIARQQPGFRLATMSDFSPLLGGQDRGDVFVQADFNADGVLDAAVLVINDAAKEYRVYALLGGHDDPQMLFARTWTQSDGRPIRTPRFLKTVGDAARRSYGGGSAALARANSLVVPLAMPALEVWTGAKHDERDAAVEDIAYCSRSWYWDTGAIQGVARQGQFKSFEVCD